MTQHRKLYDEKIAIEIESNDFWGLRDFEVGTEKKITQEEGKREEKPRVTMKGINMLC